MAKSDHLFNSEYVAQIYDAWIRNLYKTRIKNKNSFFLNLAHTHDVVRIVDIACGTGTLVIELAKQGYNVTGTDLSNEMLAIANQKKEKLTELIKNKITFVQGNMTNFSLNQEYSLAIITGASFSHLLTQQDQISTLKNVSKHLGKGGILCLNSFWPWLDKIANYQDVKKPARHYVNQFTHDNGNQIDVYEQTYIDFPTQLLHGTKIFVETDKESGKEVEYSFPLHIRLIYPSEMRLLFRLCGFQILHEYNSYSTNPIVYPKDIVWVVQKI
jgi:ubiquinone/menaquinone biosynthesis C-methylase UbiE